MVGSVIKPLPLSSAARAFAGAHCRSVATELHVAEPGDQDQRRPGQPQPGPRRFTPSGGGPPAPRLASLSFCWPTPSIPPTSAALIVPFSPSLGDSWVLAESPDSPWAI